MSEVDTVKELDYRFSHLRHMPKVGKLKKSTIQNVKKLKLKSNMDRGKVEVGSSTVIPNADLPDIYNNRYRSLNVKSPLSKHS